MNVTVERGVGLERTVTVVVPAAEVTTKFDAIAKDVARNVNLKGGYRKFSAKVARVKQLYRKNISAQLAQDLIEETLQKAVESQELKTVGAPRIVDLGEAFPARDFSYKVALEVRPEIASPKTTGYKVPLRDTAVTDEEVDEAVAKLQEEHSELVSVEEGLLTEGLELVLAITPETEDEEVKEKLALASRRVTLGEEHISSVLSDELLKQAPGATFSITATATEMPVYNPAEYADETFTWQVEVKHAERKVVPELTDEFANQARGLKSLLALRGELREELAKEKEKEARSTVRGALTHQLLINNRFDLPMRLIMEMYQERMKPYEESMTQYRAQLGDDLVNNMLAQQRHEQLGSATNEAALFFLAEAVADNEGIEITDEDVEKRLQEMADEEGVELAFIRARLGEEKIDNLKYEIRMDRIFELLESRGSTMPYDAYVHMMNDRRKRRNLHLRRKRTMPTLIARRRRRRRAA